MFSFFYRNHKKHASRVSHGYRGSRQGLVQARTLARCPRKKRDNERHVSMHSRYPLAVRNLYGFSEIYPITGRYLRSSISFPSTCVLPAFSSSPDRFTNRFVLPFCSISRSFPAPYPSATAWTDARSSPPPDTFSHPRHTHWPSWR